MEAKKRTFIEWADLLEEADLKDNEVFRWWITRLMFLIHGDLDSLSYCARGIMEGKAPRKANGNRRAELPPQRGRR